VLCFHLIMAWCSGRRLDVPFCCPMCLPLQSRALSMAEETSSGKGSSPPEERLHSDSGSSRSSAVWLTAVAGGLESSCNEIQPAVELPRPPGREAANAQEESLHGYIAETVSPPRRRSHQRPGWFLPAVSLIGAAVALGMGGKNCNSSALYYLADAPFPATPRSACLTAAVRLQRPEGPSRVPKLSLTPPPAGALFLSAPFFLFARRPAPRHLEAQGRTPRAMESRLECMLEDGLTSVSNKLLEWYVLRTVCCPPYSSQLPESTEPISSTVEMVACRTVAAAG